MYRSIRVIAVSLALAIAIPTAANAGPAKGKRLTHTVKLGETLSGLALYYGCTVEDLQALNGISGESVVQGTRLVVPWPDIRLRTAPRINVSHHKVIVGETLGTIASNYDADVRSIRLFNGLRSDRIRVGQRLQVPSAAPALKRVVVTTDVKPGDSLRRIATRFGMQQRQLKFFNPKTDWAALRIGQKVKVFRFERVVPLAKAQVPGARAAAKPATKPAAHAAHKPEPLRKAMPKANAKPAAASKSGKKPNCTCTCHKPQTAKATKPDADDDFAYRE